MGESKAALFLERVVAAAAPVFDEVIAVDRAGGATREIRTREQLLQHRVPRARLVEEIAFRRAAAGDQHAVQPFAFARQRIAALAVGVDLEARLGLEHSERLAIEPHERPLPGTPDEVLAPRADPRSRGELGGDEDTHGDDDRAHDELRDHGARPPTVPPSHPRIRFGSST